MASDTGQENDELNPLIWYVPIGFLLLALLPWPIGYFTLLRVIITGVAAVLAYLSFTKDGLRSAAWGWTFIVIAALFNPVFPVHLGRGLWMMVDIVVAGTFYFHLRTFSGGSVSLSSERPSDGIFAFQRKQMPWEDREAPGRPGSAYRRDVVAREKSASLEPPEELQEVCGERGAQAAQIFGFVALKKEFPAPDGWTNLNLEDRLMCRSIVLRLEQLLEETSYSTLDRKVKSRICLELGERNEPNSKNFNLVLDAAVTLFVAIDWIDRIQGDYRAKYPSSRPLRDFVNELTKIVVEGMDVLNPGSLPPIVCDAFPGFAKMIEDGRSS